MFNKLARICTPVKRQTPSPSAPHNRHSSGQLTAEGSKPRAHGGGEGGLLGWHYRATHCSSESDFARILREGEGGLLLGKGFLPWRIEGWGEEGISDTWIWMENCVTIIFKDQNCYTFLGNLRVWKQFLLNSLNRNRNGRQHVVTTRISL